MGNSCSSAFPGTEVAKARLQSSADRRITPGPQIAGNHTPMHRARGTYPRCTRLNDFSLLGALHYEEGGMAVIPTVRSTDEGQTWQPWGEVTRKEGRTHDCDNPFLIQLPSGKVLCAFRDHDKPDGGAFSWFRITVCQSDDLGRNWRFLSECAEDKGPVTGLWEPFMRMSADDQTLQLYYARENKDKSQNCLMRTSSDGGQTWSDKRMVAEGFHTHVRHGMIGVTETTSRSKLFAVFESGPPFYLSCAESSNDGKTWTLPRKIYKPKGTGTNAGSPQVVTVGGVLVVSFMTDEDTKRGGYPGHGSATKVITSHDYGKSWANNFTVAQPESKWPGIFALNSQSFLVLHEAANGPGAVSQRVDLA